MTCQQVGYSQPIQENWQLIYLTLFDQVYDFVDGQWAQNDWQLGSKVSLIWNDQSHHSYSKYSWPDCQWTDTQGVGLNKVWVTALIIEPLSKRAQLLPSSILTQATFSSLHQQASGCGPKKGVFCNVLMLGAPHPGMPTEQQLAFEGLSLPSLPSPLSCWNMLSGQIC